MAGESIPCQDGPGQRSAGTVAYVSRCNQRATLQLKLSQREPAAAVAEAAERECAQLPDMAIVAIEAGLVGSMTCAPTRADCLTTSEKYAGRGMSSLGEPANCSIG